MAAANHTRFDQAWKAIQFNPLGYCVIHGMIVMGAGVARLEYRPRQPA
jgi:hypothetical protein